MEVSMYAYPPLLLLEKGLVQLGFPLEDSVINGIPIRGMNTLFPLLWNYVKEICLFNAKFDLVGAETTTEKGKQDLVVRHILDSLAPWKQIIEYVKNPFFLSGDLNKIKIADIGSGAGFPGLPLALAFPYLSFSLVERMSRRCVFLENVVAILELTNVNVIQNELEKLDMEQFELVVFRAFRPLDIEMFNNLMKIKKKNGSLIAWKGKSEKIKKEMYSLEEYLKAWKKIEIRVPFLEENDRHIVAIE